MPPNPRTLNIDPADLERRITHHTVAVLVTHMNGLSADMEAIVGIVARHHHPRRGPIRIVGDAARACGASYRDTKVGAQGWATVFSFQSKKLMTTLGEGGMVTTNDDDLAGRLDRMRSFGHGSDEWGTNYKMTKPQAAVGLVQLRRLDKMNERRRELGLARSSLLCDCPLLLPFEHHGICHVRTSSARGHSRGSGFTVTSGSRTFCSHHRLQIGDPVMVLDFDQTCVFLPQYEIVRAYASSRAITGESDEGSLAELVAGYVATRGPNAPALIDAIPIYLWVSLSDTRPYSAILDGDLSMVPFVNHRMKIIERTMERRDLLQRAIELGVATARAVA